MSITEATTVHLSSKIASTILGGCNKQGEHEYVLERWAYVPGMLLMAMARAGVQLDQPEYVSFMELHMDTFIGEDGSIRTYRLEEYNLDQINEGKTCSCYTRKPEKNGMLKQPICWPHSLLDIPAPPKGDSGIRRYTLSRCGWTGCTWHRHS